MPKQKKEYKSMYIKIDPAIYDKLTRFSEETGISKTVTIERTLEKFFEEYYSRSEEERRIF